MKAVTTAQSAKSLGLLLYKSKDGRFCLYKELQNYHFSEYPLGVKFVFASGKLKVIKAFLAELTQKKERKEQSKFIDEGIQRRAEFLASLKLNQFKGLKVANNEPSLFDDFVS